jgi:hypothetical protein
MVFSRCHQICDAGVLVDTEIVVHVPDCNVFRLTNRIYSSVSEFTFTRINSFLAHPV